MDTNITNIRKQIIMKKSPKPFLATTNEAASTRTDYDTFPYTRWYRGIAEATEPIVAEREAGVRKRYDSCYELPQPPIEDNYPQHCFQNAPSVVFPCFPDVKPGNINQVQQRVNNMCNVKYR
jgi:hypothetical protein